MEKDRIKRPKVIDLADLTLKLSEYHIPSEFSQYSYDCKGENNCEEVLCFQQNVFDMGRPHIQCYLRVHQTLRFICYINSIYVSYEHFKHLCTALRYKEEATIRKVDEVVNVLATLLTIEITDLEILDININNIDNEHLPLSEQDLLYLMKEQLQFAKQAPQARRYIPEFFMKCVVWSRMSPKLYKDISKTSCLIFPSWERIKRFTSFTKFLGTIHPVSRKYFEMCFKNLDPKDLIVHMAIDEVCTTQNLEMSGGHFFGETDGQLTSKLPCHIRKWWQWNLLLATVVTK